MEKKRIIGEEIDMELALLFASHIDKPCVAEVAPVDKRNIRAFYIERARMLLSTFTNKDAREFLEAKIKEYEDN